MCYVFLYSASVRNVYIAIFDEKVAKYGRDNWNNKFVNGWTSAEWDPPKADLSGPLVTRIVVVELKLITSLQLVKTCSRWVDVHHSSRSSKHKDNDVVVERIAYVNSMSGGNGSIGWRMLLSWCNYLLKSLWNSWILHVDHFSASTNWTAILRLMKFNPFPKYERQMIRQIKRRILSAYSETLVSQAAR